MSKVKKIVVSIITGAMLFAMSITVSAASHATHAYSYQYTVCYNSYNGNQHPYKSEVIHLPSGEEVTKYGTCQTVVYEYKDLYRCGCGAVKYMNYHTEVRHANCGLN